MRGIALDMWILRDSAYFSRQGKYRERDTGMLYLKGSKCTLSLSKTCPFLD